MHTHREKQPRVLLPHHLRDSFKLGTAPQPTNSEMGDGELRITSAAIKIMTHSHLQRHGRSHRWHVEGEKPDLRNSQSMSPLYEVQKQKRRYEAMLLREASVGAKKENEHFSSHRLSSSSWANNQIHRDRGTGEKSKF